MAIADNIEINQGNTVTITITVTDDDGAAFDLTSYTSKLTVKRNASDEDTDAIIGPIAGVIATPASGIIVVTLTAANTLVTPGEYVYDVQIVNGAIVRTVVQPAVCKVVDVVTDN